MRKSIFWGRPGRTYESVSLGGPLQVTFKGGPARISHGGPGVTFLFLLPTRDHQDILLGTPIRVCLSLLVKK